MFRSLGVHVVWIFAVGVLRLDWLVVRRDTLADFSTRLDPSRRVACPLTASRCLPPCVQCALVFSSEACSLVSIFLRTPLPMYKDTHKVA